MEGGRDERERKREKKCKKRQIIANVEKSGELGYIYAKSTRRCGSG